MSHETEPLHVLLVVHYLQRLTSDIVRLPPSRRAERLDATSMPLKMLSKCTCEQQSSPPPPGPRYSDLKSELVPRSAKVLTFVKAAMKAASYCDQVALLDGRPGAFCKVKGLQALGSLAILLHRPGSPLF